MLLFLVSMLAIAMLGLLLAWSESHLLSVPGVPSLSNTHSGLTAKADRHLHRA